MRLTTPFAAAALVAAAVPAFAQAGNPEAGERVFRKCTVCHQIGDGAEHKTGPVLTGVVGRPAASMEGFAYSPALSGAAEEGLVWDHASLADFLQNPRKAMPGTKMAFPGIRKPEELADLIAYLDSFSDTPVQEAGEPAAGAEADG